MTRKIKRLLQGVALTCAICLCGCSTPKDVTYFQDASPATIIDLARNSQITAKPGDRLSIVVKTRDAAVSALFNLPVYSTHTYEPSQLNGELKTNTATPAYSTGIATYLVAPDGDIDFPELGKINVNGMTRQEIAAYIKGELVGRQLVKDPTVSVEFINTGVNVLGSVKSPGRIEINKDRFTIVEALALAGDITLQGMRNNVKVLRKENDKIHTYVVDLTNAGKTMNSPAYYLQQDDVIYVEPNEITKRSTIANGNNATNVSFWISLASLLTTVATTIGVFINK